MADIKYYEFNAGDFFKIKQKIGVFFVCKMTPKQLKKIAKKDINRYESLDEIQRDLRKGRIEEIKEFIYGKEYATFPNTFIISVSDEAIYEDNKLKIPIREDEAYILDGQHRLAGFKDDEEDFEIIVSVYIGLSKFYQAMIFANINGEQVKVNKSLVRSLYGFSEERTPEMITYSIIKLLNEQDSSPWKNGIKMLGKGDGILSLATFFDELIKEIGGNKGEGKYLFDGIFSELYKNDGEKFIFTKEDSIIYYILEDYYKSISQKFKIQWEDEKKYILRKTTGFYAFFWLLRDFINEYKKEKGTVNGINKDYFDLKIKLIKVISDNDYDLGIKGIKELINDNYKAGGVGQKALYNDLKGIFNYN